MNASADQPSSSSVVATVKDIIDSEDSENKQTPSSSNALETQLPLTKDQQPVPPNNDLKTKSEKSKKIKKATSKREPDADNGKSCSKDKEKAASDLSCSFWSGSESTICDKLDDCRDFVVWEFLNEQGIWKPYDPLICRLIENQKGKTAVVRLRRVDPKMCNIVIDFRAMQQIRLDTSSCRPVRRSLYPYDHVTLCQNIMWDWLCESGGWSRYDIDTCAYIEVAKMRKRKTVDLYKCNYLPYVINLTNMVQVKKDTGFKRRVRRIVLSNSFPRDGECPDVPGLNDSSTNVSVSKPTTSVTSTIKDETQAPQSSSNVENEGNSSTSCEEIAVHNTCEEKENSSEIVLALEEDETQSLEVQSVDNLPQEQPCCSSEVTIELNDDIETSVGRVIQSDGDAVQVVALSETPENEGIEPMTTDAAESSTNAVEVVVTSASSGTVSRLNNINDDDDHNVTADSDSPMFSSQFAYIQHVFMAPSNVSHLITRAFAHFTALMLAPIVPVLPRTPPIPIYVPPLSSRRNTRPVEGVRKPCSPKKSRQYSQQMEIVLKKFSRRCKKPPEDDCPICMMPLNEFSSFVVNENFSAGNMQLDSQIYQLKECQHVFHKTCVEELYKNGNKDGSLQCPTCKHVYGVMCGTQPPGSMNFYVIPFSLPGYPECETIQIVYNIAGGIQGLEHPCPGKEYTARGFPRKCYLPNNEEGRKILSLLVVAWERRLIFTIGRSATSGEDNTVIWNDIHHKTEFGSNTTGHGYPDPFYFSNVMSELYAKNITEDLSVLTSISNSSSNNNSNGSTSYNINNNSSTSAGSSATSGGASIGISRSSGDQSHNTLVGPSTTENGNNNTNNKTNNSKSNNCGSNATTSDSSSTSKFTTQCPTNEASTSSACTSALAVTASRDSDESLSDIAS